MTAFKRKLSFVEADVLREALPCLKRTFNLVDVEILSCEEVLEHAGAGKAGYGRLIIDSPEPGSPVFESRNYCS